MDSSPPSEMDYAERINIESNRMDIELSNLEMEGLYAPSPHENTLQTPPQNAETSNNVTDLVTPSAIPYESNALADPNLWDGHFGSVSLFGTNEVLQNDARNISCSLIRIAQFIRQRNISNRDGNTITQLSSFGDAALNFLLAVHEAGWNKLNTSDNTPIGHKIKEQFGNHPPINKDKSKNSIGNIPPRIPPRLAPKQIEEAKKRLIQRNNRKNSQNPRSYAQVSSSANDILKLRDAFPALPNKKIIEIHNATLNKPQLGGKKKIVTTTKGPSRKQAIVPILSQHISSIMDNAGIHVNAINGMLKGIKSTLRAEFIRPATQSIIISANNVPAPSDLSIIEKYIKSIDGIGINEVAAPRLPQSKSYLKIIGIPYLQPNGLAINSDDISNYLKNSELFEGTTLAAKPRIIKASPKSDMAIVWIDIWDSQNGTKAKTLINHSFNFGKYIATFRGTSMNPGVPQCHNCWKWGHTTFACKAHCAKCQKCGGPHKIENHRDFAWCCKANFKLNPPRLETKQGEPCPHVFKCVNCKGDHMADDTKCPFWKHRFNREWHSKKSQEAREIRANSIRLTAQTIYD